jgi:hypothetical protein
MDGQSIRHDAQNTLKRISDGKIGGVMDLGELVFRVLVAVFAVTTIIKVGIIIGQHTRK